MGSTREIGRGLDQRAQSCVTRGEIGQLPLELAPDAIQVAAALGQLAIDTRLGFRRQIPVPNENRNRIAKGADTAESGVAFLEDNRNDVAKLRLAHERRQLRANDRGHPRRDEEDLTAAKEGEVGRRRARGNDPRNDAAPFGGQLGRSRMPAIPMRGEARGLADHQA